MNPTILNGHTLLKKGETNGILVIDKPKGPTSHDIVLLIRRAFNIKKVGHAGTLDPMATGILVMLLGTATKLSNQLMSDEKEYEGVLKLGERTDTYDSQGKIVSKKSVPEFNKNDIEIVLNSFKGVVEQVPPMVSAIKHKGRKLYELARQGVEIKRKPRQITIHAIEIKNINLPYIGFSVQCSKGTYIRALASDIGDKLGCGAHLTELRRTRSGNFTLKDTISIEELEKLKK